MPMYIVFGQHEVTLRSNSPTAAAIEAAVRGIPLIAMRSQRIANGGLDSGGFVGSARVVRRAYLAPPGGRITTFAWLYDLPDAASLTPAQNATRARDMVVVLRDQITNALHEHVDQGVTSSDWSNISITPYNPASNGTREWWANGDAARTATRDEFALNQQLGQFEQVDNPVGPTTGRPTSIQNPLNLLPSSTNLKWIGGAVLGILGVWYIGRPVMRALTAPKQRVQYARRNPHEVANTILQQLGGANRLKMMIGAKDFMGGAYSLTFKWTAPAVNKANALTVTLTTDDTYTMTFMSLRGRAVKVVRAVEGAHAEDLARIFRMETGLALSL